MQNLNFRIYGWISALISGLVVLAYVKGVGVSLADTKVVWGVVSTLATVNFFFFFVFSKWLWKWRFLQDWLVPFPNLNGVWEGELVSTWVNPATGNGIAPIPARLTIRQTFTSISCVIQTGEMKSHSFCASFHLLPDSQIKRLVYTYASDPKPTVQDRSNRHYGTAMLDILLDEKKKTLHGGYWSDRKTTGEMSLEWKAKVSAKSLGQILSSHPMTVVSDQQNPA